jgi:hypothetical protein
MNVRILPITCRQGLPARKHPRGHIRAGEPRSYVGLFRTFIKQKAFPGVTNTTGKAKQMFIKANYQKRTIISITNLSCSDSNANASSS